MGGLLLLVADTFVVGAEHGCIGVERDEVASVVEQCMEGVKIDCRGYTENV